MALLSVDPRGRVSLARVCSPMPDFFIVESRKDGSLVLTPAEVQKATKDGGRPGGA